MITNEKTNLLLLSFFIISFSSVSLYSAGTSGCSYVWNNATTLDSDRTYECLDIKSGADVDFNGHKVTVNTSVHMYDGTIHINGGTFEIGTDTTGTDIDLIQEGGTIELDNCTILVHGNDNITGDSYFEMIDENDNVTVYGDFVMNSNTISTLKSHKLNL
jgi:redox-sensitive bicupin YhaK (pirin superfamily)